MAKLFLSLTFLLLLHGCLASEQYAQQQNVCQFQRIEAFVPNTRVRSEAGFTDFFDSNVPEFQCAGVEMLRHQIQPKGLLLPMYTINPILFYVEQGNGILGVMLPGCPETYEISQQQFEGRESGSAFQDRHQKIHHFRQGDVLAIPAGAPHWIYNDGQNDLVLVALLDSTNVADQLDQNHRRFFLAGNSKLSWGRPHGGSQEDGSENIFRGFSVEILAEAFNVDQETAEMLRSENDSRGHIIMVQKGLQIIRPPMNLEQGQNGEENGLEETICSMKLVQNIDDASMADIYNPKVGRTTSLNSFKFPILKQLKLSAERGVIYNYGIVSPHWMMNAHKIIYVTNGHMRVQIVNDQGQEVFNNKVYEGQVVIIPEHFAAVRQAGKEGCNWIAFMTNDNAMVNTLAGRSSAMSALPVDVLSYAYMIPRDEAKRLKYARGEYKLLSPLP